MKKIFIVAIILIMFMLTGCGSNNNREDISSVTFTTIDYNGGFTTEYYINLNNNRYMKKHYGPESPKGGVDYDVVKEFSDEDKDTFIKEINNSGLLNINKEYKQSGIIDGGGWHLVITFSDDSTFESRGDNDSPREVFNKCSTAFYDLCGEEVMGMLPKYYKDTPNITYSLRAYNDGKMLNGTMGLPQVVKGNYKWNKLSSLDNDYFMLTKDIKKYFEYDSSNTYKVAFSTYNYDYEKKFSKIIILEYDYSEQLENEKEIYNDGWFKQIELDISINKLYVYKLIYSDGNYVEYVFSTEISE